MLWLVVDLIWLAGWQAPVLPTPQPISQLRLAQLVEIPVVPLGGVDRDSSRVALSFCDMEFSRYLATDCMIQTYVKLPMADRVGG